MKYIIANPHNGSPVQANGVELLPGFELEVKESDATQLKQSYEFLHVITRPGSSTPAKAKVQKLKAHLEWSTVTPPESDPAPQFVVHGGKPKKGAAKVVASKSKKAVAKKKATKGKK